MTARQERRRPRSLNAALRREICERVAEGETLTRICQDTRLPAKANVLKALAADAAFRQRYEKARRLQAEHWAEEILEIVDAGVDSEDAEGRPLAEKDLLARAKLRVDARKWLLARLGAPGEAAAAADDEEEDDADPERLFARDDLSEEDRVLLRGLLERRLTQQQE